MRLLFVIKALSLPGGGAERVLSDVTRALVEAGHQVCVVSFDQSGADDFYSFHPGVQRVRLGIGRSNRRSTLRDAVQGILALRREVVQARADVAVGFMHSAYIPLGLALIRTRIPAIGSEHIVYSHYRDRPMERALVRLSALFLKAITAISEEMRQGFPPPVRHKMTVVPNPVTQPRGEMADVIGFERKILLSVGRLEPQKDHATLVSAFAHVATSFPDWDLRIVGDGALRKDLENQVRATGLENRITLPGATSEICSEYQRAQLFAMPSSYESFGLATAEALAHGLPAIGFADCPGTNELIKDGENGLLVRGDNRSAALALGLAQLMSSSELRHQFSVRAPERAAEFAPEHIAERWVRLLSAVVGGRPRRAGLADRKSAEPSIKQ